MLLGYKGLISGLLWKCESQDIDIGATVEE
jgi:hypothetical protein